MIIDPTVEDAMGAENAKRQFTEIGSLPKGARPFRTKEWLVGFCEGFKEPELTRSEKAALFVHLEPFTYGEAQNGANADTMKLAVSDWVKDMFRKREIRRQEVLCDSPMIFCSVCKK